MNIKKLREMKKNKKGFTLIEIIVVVVILAVLMAVAVPSVLNYLSEADDAKYMTSARAEMTNAQVVIAKDYTKTENKTTWTVGNVKLDPVTTKPAVTSVVANPTTAKTPGDVTSYVVTFEGNVVATVLPNDKVSVDHNK